MQQFDAYALGYHEAKKIFQFGGKRKPGIKVRAIGKRTLVLLNVQGHSEDKVKELSRD